MATLADVFRALNELKAQGTLREYAIGGATATLFYAEPARTYDVDVFVLLPPVIDSALMSLAPLYTWAAAKGFRVEAEHVFIHGVPVQFLPAHNALAEEAVGTARTHEYDGVAVRVINPEHLTALALQAGGSKRRERAWQLLESGSVDRGVLRTLLEKHGIDVEIGDEH